MGTKTEIHSLPDTTWQLPRRQLLQYLIGGLGITAVFSQIATASELSRFPGSAKTFTFPNRGEGFWQLVKSQFPLRSGLTLVNAANLCPSPYSVWEAVFALTRDIDADASFQNRDKFSDLTEYSRRALATYLGAHPEEIVITRNTTESTNMVISGLDLKQEDEVVLWDQNHPTNNVAWNVRAHRYGFQVKRVTTPTPPRSSAELIDPFRNKLTRKTKVLALTHVSNISGVGLPVKELCRIAREREILTLIDGAQTFGAFQVDLHDIGCDFYTGSTHKWLMGPKEAGVLYVRGERISDLWPSIVGAGWEKVRERQARKFETLGQRDDATLAAVGKAVDFHHSIGKERIEIRIQKLANMLKREIQRIPGVKLYTPIAPELSGGVVVLSVDEVSPREAFEYLYRKYDIGCAGMNGQFPGIRFCPHIYNSIEEIEKILAAVDHLAKKGLS